MPDLEPNVNGRLVLVPTPVGNMGDLTIRAKEVLQAAEVIAVEDPNHSRYLLSQLGITAPVICYHEQGDYSRRLERLLNELRAGKLVAVISSAGTPSISDPGFSIVRAALSENIPVECLPGATALIPALVISGLPVHRFVFEGFLPRTGKQTRLLEIANERRTVVLYESPQRLQKLLTELIAVCGTERRCCVVRELSKKFEETVRGTLGELQAVFEKRVVKGEIVVVLAGKPD